MQHYVQNAFYIDAFFLRLDQQPEGGLGHDHAFEKYARPLGEVFEPAASQYLVHAHDAALDEAGQVIGGDARFVFPIVVLGDHLRDIRAHKIIILWA